MTATSAFMRDSDHREITVPLDWARERGMSVMLIPHIAYWGSKFLWRGEINFQTTAEWDRFFGDYETWIVQMAKVAEAHGAGTFCIGLEFTEAQKFEERWRKIIAAVRAVYHGKVTYGGNWDSFEQVKFWDALDYIGVLAYFPLTKSVESVRGRNSAAPGTPAASSWKRSPPRMAQENPLRRDRLQRKRARRGGTVGVQDRRRARGGNPAALHRSGARSAAALSGDRRDVLVEMVSRIAEPRRRKLPTANARDQSADRQTLALAADPGLGNPAPFLHVLHHRRSAR